MSIPTPTDQATDLLGRITLALYTVRDLRALVDAQERWLTAIQLDMTQWVANRNWWTFFEEEKTD